MKDVSVHTIGGVNTDKDPRALNPNELSYANDNEVFGTVGGRDTSSYPLPSSKLAYTIPSLQTQYQFVRAKFDPTATSYALQFRDNAGDLIGPSSINITVAALPSPTVTNFVSAIDTALSAYGYSATFDTEDGVWFSLAIYSGAGTPIFFSMTESETIGGVTSRIDIYTLQEYFNPIGALSGQMKELQSIQLQNYQIVFSKSYDGQGQSIGYAVEDKNGDWTYTSLIISRQFEFPEDEVIDIQTEEVSNNQFGIYWTAANSGKPKTLYVPTDMSSPLRYTMSQYATQTLGLFTLESLDEQTNTQIQNYARIEFSSQNQSGGNLEAGTWFYFVASGINRNYSEWSPASEPIPVFTETTNGPSAGAVVGGDKTPKVTGKANVLNILGVDAKVYDTVRVAAMVL